MNSKSFLAGKLASEWPNDYIDPKAIDLLNEIVKQTGCHIVISSTWRASIKWQKIAQMFASVGFLYPDSIIDQTPRAAMDNRGMEIAAWLAKHPEIKNFVILDDDADMAHLIGHLVQTDWETGLTEGAAASVIKCLTSAQS